MVMRRTARTSVKVNVCKDLVDCNRRSTIRQLWRHLGISYGSVFTLLHQDLELDKKSGKLIPHALTDFDRRRRLGFCHELLDQYAADPRCLQWVMTTDESWFHAYDPFSNIQSKEWLSKGVNRPQIVCRELSVPKLMFIPFFDHRGLVHWEMFRQQTVDKKLFLALLKRVRESIRIRRGAKVWHNRREYLIHMDNAPAHRSKLVQDYLKDEDWSPLKHPPYLPDLSPADFFLFPRLKRVLHGHNFGNLDHLQEALESELSLITRQEWADCFEEWIRRCH